MAKNRNEQENYTRNVGFDLRQAYNTDGTILYVGYAYPKTTDDELKWQIFKCAYDASKRLTHRRYGNGTDNFDKSWTLRTSYDYLDI